MKSIRLLALLGVCVAILVGVARLSYNRFREFPDEEILLDSEEFVDETEFVYASILPTSTVEEVEILASVGAEIIYQYINLEDMSVEIVRDTLPNFMAGKTHEEVASVFSSWDIVSFESSEIILRKEISTIRTESYIVGVLGGHIAIFHGNSINGNNLREVTSIAISALPQEDRERLLRGIHVSGEVELLRLLEDFSS